MNRMNNSVPNHLWQWNEQWYDAYAPQVHYLRNIFSAYRNKYPDDWLYNHNIEHYLSLLYTLFDPLFLDNEQQSVELVKWLLSFFSNYTQHIDNLPSDSQKSSELQNLWATVNHYNADKIQSRKDISSMLYYFDSIVHDPQGPSRIWYIEQLMDIT